jgi:hypothetical protein
MRHLRIAQTVRVSVRIFGLTVFRATESEPANYRKGALGQHAPGSLENLVQGSGLPCLHRTANQYIQPIKNACKGMRTKR